MPKIIRKLTEKEVRNARPKSKPYKMCDEGGLPKRNCRNFYIDWINSMGATIYAMQ